jgi:hypothetical protein
VLLSWNMMCGTAMQISVYLYSYLPLLSDQSNAF